MRVYINPAKKSANRLNPNGMSRARGEWVVARDQRSVESLRESDVSGVAGAHVVSQLPRASQQIYMGMTVQVEINKIRDCAGRPAGRDLTRSYETSETLEHFDIHQVRRMTFVVVAKEAFFESYANWRLHGRQLFYRRRQQVLVVDVLETPRPTVSAPRPALDLPADVVAFDVDPAGDRFVIARRAAPAAPANEVRVITNWWSVAAARDGAGKTAGLAQR